MGNLTNHRVSFAGKIKAELSNVIPESGHCQMAELMAISAFCGIRELDKERLYALNTDSDIVTKKYFTLFSNSFRISKCEEVISRDELGKLNEYNKNNALSPVNDELLKRDCCKKAFVRGAFLAGGSVSDPNKAYRLEIVTDDEVLLMQVFDALNNLNISAKITQRKANHIVYIKDGTQISEILGQMGASVGMMEFENVKIFKGMRNDLNRKVNCEAANIKKTVDAALSQIKDIEYLDTVVGLGELPESLMEVARLRLSYPEATLSELGSMLNPKLGKSGINHRLRRISRFAAQTRKEGRS